MEVRKAVFLYCAAVLTVEHRQIIMRGVSLSLQEGALFRASACSLPGWLAKAEGMEHQTSLYHLLIPWVSGVPSQFPHPHTGSEGQPSPAYWGEDERRCTWAVLGTQLVFRIWTENPFTPFSTQMPPPHCIGSSGRIFCLLIVLWPWVILSEM